MKKLHSLNGSIKPRTKLPLSSPRKVHNPVYIVQCVYYVYSFAKLYRRVAVDKEEKSLTDGRVGGEENAQKL